MTITERLAEVVARIERAATHAGRDPRDVKLVAVSKTHPIEAVIEAHQAGQVDFGESYAQELRDKAAHALAVRWHFIGRLQTNKAKYIAPHAYRVHALESRAQAEALSARLTRPLKCLVSVNLSGEASKSGVAPDQALAACAELASIPHIEVVGLMTLPPAADDPSESEPYFEQLAKLAAQGRACGLPLQELSMGMSHDVEAAIAHGATWVRVGTAIFGPRER